MASRYHGELEVALEDIRGFFDTPIYPGDWVLLGKLREGGCDIVPVAIDDMRHHSMYCLRTFIMDDWYYGASWDYELWHVCPSAS